MSTGAEGTDTDRLATIRRLHTEGRSAAAVDEANAVLADSKDPAERAWASLMGLSGLLNLERSTEYPAAIERVHTEVTAFGEPVAVGYFHALAAICGTQSGESLERCVTHLVRSSRILNTVDTASLYVSRSWRNLAVAFSYLGFNDRAADAAAHAAETAKAAGIAWRDPLPQVQLRRGLTLDYQGDGDGCARVLQAMVIDAVRAPTTERGLPDLVLSSLPWIGYAAARLAAIGRDPIIDVRRFLGASGHNARVADLRHFGRVCQSIAAGDTDQARQLLQRARSRVAALGRTEQARLRAVSYVADKNFTAAYTAEREAFAIYSRSVDRLRGLYADAVAARIDSEDPRRGTAGSERPVPADPGTGARGRRRLQDYVQKLMANGETGVIGIVEIEGLVTAAKPRGRTAYDSAMRKVGDALVRVMRRRDVVARYNDAQFITVLPNTPLSETPEIGRRIVKALAAEDLDPLSEDSLPHVSVNWAELSSERTAAGEVAPGLVIIDRAIMRARRSG